MSKKNVKSIDNAVEVIERFGGIRPMSTKTDIPVTTIQGWKKRDSIPANRVEEIIKAAQSNNVEISDLVEGGSANQNAKVPETKPAESKPAKTVKSEAPKASVPASTPKEDVQVNEGFAALDRIDAKNKEKEVSLDVSYDKIQKQIEDVEAKAVQKSVLISSGIFVVVLIAIGILLWPKADEMNDKLESNARQIAEIEETGGTGISTKVSDFIPEGWQTQIDGWMGQAEEIKKDAIAAKDQAQAALKKVEEISTDVLGSEAGTITQRYTKLQEHAGELMANPEITQFFDQLQMQETTASGQQTMDSAMNELMALFSQFTGNSDMLNQYLDQARQQSAAMGTTFDGVPTEDMKAAALLFTFNQMRSALNREGQPFGDDLALLKNFIGNDNTELHAAIDRLAPRAQDGVLTIGGLSEEFRNLAGDAVVASLQGEDVSVQEKAKARFNELFSVEQNGELLTGTETQADLKRVQDLLAQNKLEEAIAVAKTLEGPEAEIIAPWIEKAEATKAADEVKEILDYNIELRTNPEAAAALETSLQQNQAQNPAGPLEGAAPTEQVIPGNMIYDPKSGLRIYIPSQTIITP